MLIIGCVCSLRQVSVNGLKWSPGGPRYDCTNCCYVTRGSSMGDQGERGSYRGSWTLDCLLCHRRVTSEFKVKKGVRQGCVLSPNLFNLYTEKIFREVEDMKGVNIGGVNINNLRYADDTVLLAEGPMFLQALLTAVNEKGK